MASKRVLIIEDDNDINQIVATHLARRGFSCTQAYSGTEARMLLGDPGAGRAIPFDLVISDLMLPGLTGEELVALIRERDASVPIIVTSARTATNDKLDLFKLGADDYLAKPFDLDELTARIEVQLRHRERMRAQAGRGASNGASAGMTCGSAASDPASGAASGNTASKSVGSAADGFFGGGLGNAAGMPLGSAGDNTLTFRSWELDPAGRTFTANGHAVELTRIDFNIVEVLMRSPKRVFSKQELFERAWGEPYAADDNTINVHISKIRAKLKETGTDGYLKTVWGMGFKLAER